MTNSSIPPALHLRDGGTSVLIDTTTPGLPTIVHWGADLGDLADDVLADACRGVHPQRVSGGLDVTPRLTLLPQESAGWQGTPGLLGSRRGRDFSSALTLSSLRSTRSTVDLVAQDPTAQLRLDLQLAVTSAGLVTTRLTLTNEGADDYEVAELAATLPLPSTATEILDTTGRHLRERHPQRHDLTVGRHVRESRRGRPGADSTVLLVAGTPGFAFERGLAHGIHLAWSGNHSVSAERSPSAPGLLRASELLAPGEMILAAGESYQTPSVVASWGEGLNELSSRFHRQLRERPAHPATVRPVTLNTWEAVYFDQDLGRLTALADLAADVGVERFVLDDGWFTGRRDDTGALGDWTVDADIWPDGLHPLFDHVSSLGLQCGLWVEPEMISPRSMLAVDHPEWILQTGGRLPVEGRQQQVLDLSNPAAFDYVFGCLDALLTEYPIVYLKWDHNRDLVEAGSTLTGRSAVHATTLAVYRLMDALRAAHPGLEIESCASGGARVDLGVLEHTDRIWASDCIDPLERLTIQKYTGLVVPPELMGEHIGGPRADTTGRRHDLSLRGGVALFGHFGVEWDLTETSEHEQAELASWIRLHKRWRDVLHTGTTFHADLPDASMDLRGVVAGDGETALFVYTQVSSAGSHPTGILRFPGLDDAALYRVGLVAEPQTGIDAGQSRLSWRDRAVEVTGAVLRRIGLQAPVLLPEQLVVIEIARVPVP